MGKMMGWIKGNDYNSVWQYEEYAKNFGDIEYMDSNSTTTLDDTQYDNYKKSVLCCLNENQIL